MLGSSLKLFFFQNFYPIAVKTVLNQTSVLFPFFVTCTFWHLCVSGYPCIIVEIRINQYCACLLSVQNNSLSYMHSRNAYYFNKIEYRLYTV